MAKKKFNISSTLKKNKEEIPPLAKKVPLKKRTKNVEEIKEKVEAIHKEEQIVPPPIVEEKSVPKAVPVQKQKPIAKIPAKPKPKKTTASTPKLVRLTIDTPAEMHKRLKIEAIESGMSMREYILRLLEKSLK